MRRLHSLSVLAALAVLVFGGIAAADEPAKVSLARQTENSGATRLVATVTDNSGAPVGGSTVTFLAKTAFGWLKLADVATDAGGRAVLILPPASAHTEVTAQAGDEPSLHAGVLLDPAQRPELARRPGPGTLRALSPQPGFISPYPVPQLLLLGVILGGIWTTYAYLVSLLIRIKRAR